MIDWSRFQDIINNDIEPQIYTTFYANGANDKHIPKVLMYYYKNVYNNIFTNNMNSLIENTLVIYTPISEYST